MKQIYKKLLAAALGVSMLLSMVGCGHTPFLKERHVNHRKRSEGTDDRHSKGTGQPYDTDHEQGE